MPSSNWLCANREGLKAASWSVWFNIGRRHRHGLAGSGASRIPAHAAGDNRLDDCVGVDLGRYINFEFSDEESSITLIDQRLVSKLDNMSKYLSSAQGSAAAPHIEVG
ncbi:hypothetical protein ON010_g10451 [Phytophthora cinnamomi]|nr:hypothetical protein ON010_g10451 [Phytophthora cinnamomi]